MSDGMNRRGFLKVLGATGTGAAALTACGSDNAHKLIPYLVPPENQIPGIATLYATTCRECPAGCGLHVRVREGRALKVEGNPSSPINAGKLCARGQATLQGLYNPDRLSSPMRRGADGRFQPISWDEAIQAVVQRAGSAGNRVAFLTGAESGSFGALLDQWMAALGAPGGRTVFEPFGYEALRAANQTVFGSDSIPHYDFAAADLIVSFGADFIETWLSPMEYTRGFTASHAYREGSMGKFVHIEPRMSLTAIQADEWLAPHPGTEGAIALAMARVILDQGLGSPPPDSRSLRALLDAHTPAAAAQVTGIGAEAIEALAHEFAESASVGVAGGMAAQHDGADATAVAVSILNYVAGNVGTRVVFGTAGDPAGGSTFADLANLTSSMASGSYDVLFVHGANPVYAAPALDFAGAMERVGFKVSFASMIDETAAQCDLVLPDHHALEQWNDTEPRPGTIALQQPVMQPVMQAMARGGESVEGTRQTGDVLLQIAAAAGGRVAAAFDVATFKEYVRSRWQVHQRRVRNRDPFDTFWNSSLQQGGHYGSVTSQNVRLARNVQALSLPASRAADGLTLIVYPSSVMYDGRSANSPWLQELPDPVAKVTWDSWVELSPHTAAEHDIREGDFVEVTTAHGSVALPAFVYPGVHDDVVAIAAGRGHAEFGRYGTDVGVNAFALLDGSPNGFGGRSHQASATIRKTNRHERLAKTAGQYRQMGRGIAQATTLAALVEGHAEEHHAEHAAPIPEHLEQVLEEWQEAQWEDAFGHGPYEGVTTRWAMAVDLSKCTGCSACVTACYAENNIATVGKDQVGRGREMAWIRIERYWEGGEHGEPLEVRLLPMMCQQCGNAPCEPVCPVFAAYHTPDGLNAQVYNRCVGTRYCSNNCPYKVRYFNYYDYANPGDAVYSWPEPLNWQLNPDITVRSKGVMEKCTFCIQRIRGAQHQAALDGREVADGEIVTACQETCPANAIVFGDLGDPDSTVSQVSGDERGYHVLESLNTYPAVTYLKKVRNVSEA